MHMAVHGQPAVAFWIGAGAIELAGDFGQADHQRIALVAIGVERLGLDWRSGTLRREGVVRGLSQAGRVGVRERGGRSSDHKRTSRPINPGATGRLGAAPDRPDRMTSSPLQRTVAWLPRAMAALLALGPASPASLRAEPLPPAPPLNPAWAFDPNGPYLPGADPPSFLLPANGQRFNPSKPGQPQAISGPPPPIAPCPLIVPVREAALQPLHLHPSQVPLKNSFGCLSPSDAIYGADGCPKRLCGTAKANQISLPQGGP